MRFKSKKEKFVAAAAVLMTAACGSDEPKAGNVPSPGVTEPSAEAPTHVIYEVNPRFYGNSGCLAKLTADIPRIAGMGCDILWVMPPFEIGELKAVGSPYCVRDYENIDPALGTVSDFKTFVKTAHDSGMKVILDWVANHTSFDNVWTLSNPERYVKDSSGNIAATQQWGDVAQLDYSVASTREGMIDAMKYWLENTGIDGFRCDYAEGVPHEFWKEAVTHLKKMNPDIVMLAESSQPDFWNDGFDLIYDWNFPTTVANTFGKGDIAGFGNYVSEQNSKVSGKGNFMRYAFNHDVASENDVAKFYGSPDGTVAAYVLAAFSGAVPMIYSSMDAEDVSGKLSFFSNAHRDMKFSDTLTSTYRAVNEAYTRSAVPRGGEMKFHSSSDAVVQSFVNGDKTLLVIVNISDDDKAVKTPIVFAGETFDDLISGNKVTLSTTVSLPAFGYVILMK